MAEFEYFTIKKVGIDPENEGRAIYIDLIEIDDGYLEEWAEKNGYIKTEDSIKNEEVPPILKKFSFRNVPFYMEQK